MKLTSPTSVRAQVLVALKPLQAGALTVQGVLVHALGLSRYTRCSADAPAPGDAHDEAAPLVTHTIHVCEQRAAPPHPAAAECDRDMTVLESSVNVPIARPNGTAAPPCVASYRRQPPN